MIRVREKRITRAVYVCCCGYCGVSETLSGAELTYDHFRPQSQGGADNAANLVYACHACNEFKGEYWSEAEENRLLHPLTDDLTQHIIEEPTGALRPLTTLGQIYINQLQLNRAPLVANRLERQRMARIENLLAEIAVTIRDIATKTLMPEMEKRTDEP